MYMKKFFCFLMSGLLLCQFMTTNVFAASELVTPDEIVSNANEYEEGVFTIENDSSNKQFIVTIPSKSEKKAYPYMDEYFEYRNDNDITTEEDLIEVFADSVAIAMVAMGSYRSLGCSDEQLQNIASWFGGDEPVFNSSNYDKYGIIMSTDYYYVATQNSKVSGVYAKYFKFSFEKEKMQNVIKDYSNTKRPDSSDDYELGFVPSISFGTISADRITIAANLDKIGFDSAPYCNIYRSESADGFYRLIGSVACDGTNYLYDNDVVKGKEYFYKAAMMGHNTLSKTYSATASAKLSTPSKNPDTGISIAYVVGALLLVLTFASVLVFYRNKLEIK